MVYTPCRTGKPCSRAGQDSTHRRLRKEMHFNEPKPQAEFVPPLSFFEKCCILDDMPIAYCVIELVFDEDGHGVVFVFRYCYQPQPGYCACVLVRIYLIDKIDTCCNCICLKLLTLFHAFQNINVFYSISFLKQIICCHNILHVIISNHFQWFIFSIFGLFTLIYCIRDLNI